MSDDNNDYITNEEYEILSHLARRCVVSKHKHFHVPFLNGNYLEVTIVSNADAAGLAREKTKQERG